MQVRCFEWCSWTRLVLMQCILNNVVTQYRFLQNLWMILWNIVNEIPNIKHYSQRLQNAVIFSTEWWTWSHLSSFWKTHFLCNAVFIPNHDTNAFCNDNKSDSSSPIWHGGHIPSMVSKTNLKFRLIRPQNSFSLYKLHSFHLINSLWIHKVGSGSVIATTQLYLFLMQPQISLDSLNVLMIFIIDQNSPNCLYLIFKALNWVSFQWWILLNPYFWNILLMPNYDTDLLPINGLIRTQN